MSKIILLFSNNDIACDRFCNVCRQKIMIVDEDEWIKLENMFHPNSGHDTEIENLNIFLCDVYTISDYINCCQVIEKYPSDEIMKFAEKISDNDVFDNIYKSIIKMKKESHQKKFKTIVETIGSVQLAVIEEIDEKIRLAKTNKKENAEKKERLKKRNNDNKIGYQTGKFIIQV